MHLVYSRRAVSHFIAGLMLVCVAAAVSFVTYIFVMNYVSFSTAKSGKAIEIQNMNLADGCLRVYVQNVGQEVVSFDPANCIYIDGKLENCTVNGITLLTGETATITVNGLIGEPNILKVRVTTTDGTSTEAMLQ